MNCAAFQLTGRSAWCRPATKLASTSFPSTLTQRRRLYHRIRPLAASSSPEENGGSSTAQKNESQLRQTVADLDAILGIQEEPEELPLTDQKEPGDPLTNLSSETKEEIRSLAKEVTEKLNDDSEDEDSKKEQEFIETMTNIVKNAASNAEGKSSGKNLLESLEKLLETASTSKDQTNEDVQIMKDRIFGADTFWVTEVITPNDGFGGHRFRGNMRGKNEKEVFLEVEAKVKEQFGDRYEVLMFEEPLTPDQMTEANAKPKVCFQVVLSDTARPPKSPSWRPVAAGVLFLFTLATSYILGVSANIGSIPQPIVEYLSRPEHLNADEWPEFVRSWDPSSFLRSSATVAISIMFVQLAHEVGHRVMAFLKRIKLKGSLLLPNTQIGSFGSVTQLDSLVKSRQDLWDFAFAGLAGGGIASVALFFTGLVITQDGSVPKESLVPVPSVLLQGSTFIGGLLQVALGEATKQRMVYLHPFTIAGWCGLTATALNALPVGNLDGGRMMLSAYGRQSLNVSSIFTYAGLALGVLGSSLALPFGLYVLICDRDPEAYIQNQVTPTDRTRQWISAVAIGVAVLILLPMGLFDANDAGLGPGGPLI